MTPTIGRTVLFVLNDGQVRPMIITAVHSADLVNGQVMIDDSNDRMALPESMLGGVKREDAQPKSPVWATSVSYDPNKTAHSWHWPERV